MKVTSEGHERSELWSRAKRVTVVFNDTPMEEGSGVFFLTLLTSLSLCSHSLLWRKVLECSSSPCSLRHPCVLTHSYGGRFWSVLPHTTHFVIPVSSLTSSSLCPHSLRHPCVLTPMTCLLTHLIVIPDFSLESSHPSHLTLSLPSLVLPLIPYSVFSHTPTLIALTQVISSSSLTTHSHHSCYHSSHTQCSHTHPHSSHSPKSSHTLTPITCATMLTHPRLFSHHSYYHSLTRVFSH